MSFFELYDLLINNKLKMSKLELMDDINEGLGSALKLQESMAFGWDLRDKEKFKNFHSGSKGRTYITCWTEIPEAISMWLLYSKDQSSIRVKTSLEKLKNCMENYFKNNFITKHINSPEGTFQLDNVPIVKAVEYAAFEDISNKIKRKHYDYIQELEKHDHTKFIENGLPKELEEISSKKVITVENGALLKDIAYSHENEIRATFTACLRNGLPAEEWERNKNSDDPRYVFGTATCHYPESNELANIVYVPIGHDFIEEICFDPRMPSYKINVYLETLGIEEKGINVATSNSFGYKPDNFDFSIEI